MVRLDAVANVRVVLVGRLSRELGAPTSPLRAHLLGPRLLWGMGGILRLREPSTPLVCPSDDN